VSNYGHRLRRYGLLALTLFFGGMLIAPLRAAEPSAISPASAATQINPQGISQPVFLQSVSPGTDAAGTSNSPSAVSPAVAATIAATGGGNPQDNQVTPATCNCESGNGPPNFGDGGMSNMNGGCPECHGVDYNKKPCGNDFWWGCGAFPWENGPGPCDDWLVGPRWDVTVEGMTMFRPNTDLNAIAQHNPPTNTPGAFPVSTFSPYENEFDWGVGGRVDVTGHLPDCAGYWVEAVYEGINEWDASVVFPKVTPIPGLVSPTPPALVDSSQQRSIRYVSVLQSAELDFERPLESCVQPFWGIRYIRFADKLSDFVNQDIPLPPLPGNPTPPTIATDRLNRFNLENNLIGFQVGAHRASLHLTPRLSLEGTCNAGVYYNQIHRQNLMTVTTTQAIADNTSTLFPGRTDISTASNNDVTELGEISYAAEASLSAVCRLNKCVALTGGYQYLWLDNLRLADKAYFERNTDGDNLLFQGWHVGIECRR
jgi:Putative beta barrel porin-7 (BBP7)